MNRETLVTMANQIGAFYETMPDREKAINDIFQHIRKFWEPRMRRELMAYIEDAQQNQLTPIVLQAIQNNRADM